MKIILEYPFNQDFKSGYVNINKEPRRVCLLVRYDGTKTSTSFARYMMCCKLKRYLTADEHVDHIDNDKMNDVIDNLQILTPIENTQKSKKQLSLNTFTCPVCNIIFQLPLQRSHKIQPTCSRRCGGIKSHWKK